MSPTVGLAANFLTLTVILITLPYSGPNPHVIVYSFILLIYARFLTIEAIQGLYHLSRPGIRGILRKACSPPRPGQTPVKLVEKYSGRALSSWHYFLILTALLVYYFLMMTAFSGQRFEFDSPWIAGVVRWGLIYTAIYWMQDLVDRKITIDFKKRRETNLGYNMAPMAALGINIYAVSFLGWVSQKLQLNLVSPWLICGMFLFIKHGMDFYLPRRRFKPGKEPTARKFGL